MDESERKESISNSQDIQMSDRQPNNEQATTPHPDCGASANERPTPDHINYPSKDGTILSQFYSQPLVTTLSSFSHVANLAKNPYELINNVDEFFKQVGGTRSSGRNQARRNNTTRNSENFARALNQNREPSTPTSPVQQEMDTFVERSSNSTSSTQNQSFQHLDDSSSTDRCEAYDERMQNLKPIPALPPIETASKRGRLTPLTIEEYENHFKTSSSDLEIIERIFYGGIACDQLRAAIWPYLFGIVKHRGSFDRISNSEGRQAFIFVEHEENMSRWRELNRLYQVYQNQWKGILPDQETRFSTFRERKSLIERDVIRCDRLHPFYADESSNLDILTNLLMTYMMYDFDIGYVQGMSDLAGPILYLYRGDLIKSFWVFVEVMKLFRRNFELTQKTVHFQLDCLNELVRITDPIFSQYLRENESSNCFFAFRAIVCLFKRELMKENEADYKQVLYLWDTVWCVNLIKKHKDEKCSTIDRNIVPAQDSIDDMGQNLASNSPVASSSGQAAGADSGAEQHPFHLFNPNQSDTPRYSLTETEVFILALCLSMIRSERDLIMGNQLDCTDIHLHFIDPKLADDLNGFIERAINIYSFLKNDFDLKRLTSPAKDRPSDGSGVTKGGSAQSPVESTEGYDLLSDFLVINGASGS